MTTLSPGLMVSTGFCALSYQPNCVVSMVAGSRCIFPGAPVATATVCAVAASLKIASNVPARMPSAILDCVFIPASLVPRTNTFGRSHPLSLRGLSSRARRFSKGRVRRVPPRRSASFADDGDGVDLDQILGRSHLTDLDHGGGRSGRPKIFAPHFVDLLEMLHVADIDVDAADVVHAAARLLDRRF